VRTSPSSRAKRGVVARDEPSATDRAAVVASAVLAGVVLATSLLVDPAAEASFDAPKRLALVLGSTLAAGVLLASPHRAAVRRHAPTTAQRAALLLLAGAATAVLAAALASPRRGVALDSLRTAALTALLLPLGASRALADGRAGFVLGAFLAASAVNAAAVLVERFGGEPMFAVEAVAGRGATGAFVGNEGTLGLALAMAGVASAAVALLAASRRTRVAAAGSLAVDLLALAVLPTLTAILAFATGGLVVARAVLGRRAAVAALAGVGLLGAAVAASPPLRARAVAAIHQVRAGDWDALVTHRFGPWSAALEMARERPLLGFGPGTFAAEFVPHRLRAELRQRRRLLIPRETSTYSEAHNEPLQLAAEAGVPAAALALGASLVVGVALVPRARRVAGREEVVVLGMLAAGAVAALTWFPLQQPVTAAPLLLALGRGWRLLGEVAPPVESDAGRPAPWSRAARLVVAAALLVAVVPELSRHRAERALARATGAVRATLRMDAATRHERRGELDGVASAARAIAPRLRGDSRALLAAAAADLVAGRPERALDAYAEALRAGERAEIDLNVGRAYALLDRRAEALAAFVRAGWLSPALIPHMPAAAQPLVAAECGRLEGELRRGTLATPPPRPLLEEGAD
jgi:O-antigen ligase